MDRTIIKADEDFDGKISFEEFCKVSILMEMIIVDGQRFGCGR